MIVTNAAGSLMPSLPPGSLMLINDHINFSGRNPLIGPNDDSFGPRFPDMSNAYDRKFRNLAHRLAKDAGIKLHDGTYLMVSGPNFETAAEIRAFPDTRSPRRRNVNRTGSLGRRLLRNQSPRLFGHHQLRHRFANHAVKPPGNVGQCSRRCP